MSSRAARTSFHVDGARVPPISGCRNRGSNNTKHVALHTLALRRDTPHGVLSSGGIGASGHAIMLSCYHAIRGQLAQVSGVMSPTATDKGRLGSMPLSLYHWEASRAWRRPQRAPDIIHSPHSEWGSVCAVRIVRRRTERGDNQHGYSNLATVGTPPEERKPTTHSRYSHLGLSTSTGSDSHTPLVVHLVHPYDWGTLWTLH